MKKNDYTAPTVAIVNVKMKYTLLAGSEVGLSDSEYNSSINGSIRSRESGSFWDDEEE